MKLPPKLKQKGKPRDYSQTVIGISRKRKRQDTQKPVKFSKKTPEEKDRSMNMCVFNVTIFLNYM